MSALPLTTSEEVAIAKTLCGVNANARDLNRAIKKITVVKPSASVIVSRRREELLRNIDYMEAQIGRLAKMARDVRAEILLLTTE